MIDAKRKACVDANGFYQIRKRDDKQTCQQAATPTNADEHCANHQRAFQKEQCTPGPGQREGRLYVKRHARDGNGIGDTEQDT